MGNTRGKICQGNEIPKFVCCECIKCITSKNKHDNEFTEIPMPTENDIRSQYSVTKVELGRGGYGVVRKCTNRQTRKKFAVKTIKKIKVRHIEYLREEVLNMKSLSHPNIAQLVDVFEDDKYFHLVTPLFTGGDLYEHIVQRQDCKFSEPEAARLVRQMLDALAYCHSHGIVHRDVKPENFVFESRNKSTLKLIDFGLSAHSDPFCHQHLTSEVGTPLYTAPEVLARKYNNKCDVWSIGIILYILLSGCPPFDGSNEDEIYDKVKHMELKFPSATWAKVSPEAKSLVNFLLQRDHSNRPSAEQALAHPWFKKSTGRKNTYTFAHSEFIHERFLQYVKMNRFQKITLNFIVQHLAAKDIGYLNQLFQEWDLNGDGIITIEELRHILRKEGLENEYQSLALGPNTLFKVIDLNGDEKIDYREFVAAVVDRNLCIKEDALHLAFDHFDKHHSGHISACDIAENFENIEDAQDTINKFDVDGNGLLEYEEFRNMMRLQ